MTVCYQLHKYGVNRDLSGCDGDRLLLKTPKARSTLNLLARSQSQLEKMNIISELCDGENVLVDDLKVVVKVYKHPLKKLGILTSAEIYQLFYTIESVIPLFERLANDLSSGFKKSFDLPVIGTILSLWLGIGSITELSSNYLDNVRNRHPLFSPRFIQSVHDNYVETMPSSVKILLDYSVHLYEARKYYDALREQRPAFNDFLSRCSHTNFSKRLDLWHFLECPKTRLIRYPLLLDRLIKLTPSTDPDLSYLLGVRSAFISIAQELNRKVGTAMRDLYLKHIEFDMDFENKDMLWRQKSLLLKGNLHTDVGEVTVFVFPELLLVTTRVRPEVPNRSATHLYYNNSPRQNTRFQSGSVPTISSTSTITPLLPSVSDTRSQLRNHRRSLLPSLKSHSCELRSVQVSSVNSSDQPSKCRKLFRRLSSIILPPSITESPRQSEISRKTTPIIHVFDDESVCFERYRTYGSPVILREYILEDINDDNHSGVLKLPFSLEKSNRNLFRLYSYNDYFQRSEQYMIKGLDSLHPDERNLSNSRRKLKWALSSSLRSKKGILFSHKHPKMKSKEFIFQASSADDKMFWITTLSPLVHSIIKRNRMTNYQL
ncbi:unnamed protein product [Heterobilharzia americana]|nr:unnamed protein product [Heterobilharzia americana]CAH8587366.1 unnamed protein product [Heterobilharzia americana]